MNYWFLILMFLNVLGLGIAIGKHGDSRSDYNAFTTLIASIIEAFLIIMAILHGGLIWQNTKME